MSKPRRERRIAHEYRERTFHTHEQPARKDGHAVAVRCTKPNCRKDGKNQ